MPDLPSGKAMLERVGSNVNRRDSQIGRNMIHPQGREVAGGGVLSSEMILTTEFRASGEAHTDSSSPQPFSNSKTVNNHEAGGRFLLLSFIVMLMTPDLPRTEFSGYLLPE
jgi:hypothetical protein